MKNNEHCDSSVLNSLIFCDVHDCAYVSSCGLLSLSACQMAFPCRRYSWQIPCKVVDMLAVNMLAEGMLVEDMLAEGMLAGDMKMKNCDFVNSSLGPLGLTLDKMKRLPWAMKRYMGD